VWEGRRNFLIYSSIFCVNVGLFSISPSFGSLLTPYLIYVDGDDDDDDDDAWIYRP